MKFSNSLFIFVFALCHMHTLCTPCYGQDNETITKEFTLRTVRAGEYHIQKNQKVHGSLTQKMKGQLHIDTAVLKKNTGTITLLVEELDRSFSDENISEHVQPLSPFTASITFRKEPGKANMELDIKEGEMQDNKLGLSNQYRFAYGILDMLLLNRENLTNREIVITSKSGEVSLPKFKKIQTSHFGEMPTTKVDSFRSATDFRVLPMACNNESGGIRLQSFPSPDVLGLEFSVRELNEEGTFAVHGINLSATPKRTDNGADKTSNQKLASHRTTKKKLSEFLQWFKELDNFEQYEFDEFSLQ